ncbi:MAG TPA: DUF934 domain-containing protein [Candidatus Acidoferrum sp.]|nr:DUF934 domain-containing protein [Candidatus Acidoferrum sp.]
MPRLIDTLGNVVDNAWDLLPKDATLDQAKASAAKLVIVACQLWLAEKAALLSTGKTFGVWLDSNETAGEIAGDLSLLPLVALNFPTFMDGRAYSTAALLREHYDYEGEIRAIGDVLRDQLFFMKRCGFTSFNLKDSVKLEDAQKALKDFSTTYASTVEEPVPLFRRRAM